MTKKDLRLVQAAALVLVAVVYMGARSLPIFKGPAPIDKGGFYYVSRVVDGDTLKLAGGQRVRLIGVDTPEVYYSDKLFADAKKSGMDIEAIQSMGKRASDFTKSLCGGNRVKLEYDVERRDRYGRLLAYVYLEDGTFVNAKILEEGYGQVMTIPPNVKHADMFLELQREARKEKRGLWKR